MYSEKKIGVEGEVQDMKIHVDEDGHLRALLSLLSSRGELEIRLRFQTEVPGITARGTPDVAIASASTASCVDCTHV